jgi:hypothetical protein
MLIAALLFSFGANAFAGMIILNFEGFSDSTILTNQYSSITFSNAVILTAGISLNEFEFPPYSGVNVVSDNSGPLSIDFATPITNFSGYFTYVEPLTINAFDAFSTLVASAVSAFSSNDALFGATGSSPNEYIQVSAVDGISSITITGDPTGGSFVLDNATISMGASSIPEPATSKFVLAGIFFGVFIRSLLSRSCRKAGSQVMSL